MLVIDFLLGFSVFSVGFFLLLRDSFRKNLQKAKEDPHPKYGVRLFYFVYFGSLFAGFILYLLSFFISFFLSLALSILLIMVSVFYFLFKTALLIYRKIPEYRSPYRVEPLKPSVKLFYDPPVEISFDELNKHVHVLAPSGAGKTKSVLAPLVVQLLEKGIGVLCIDPKGDNEVISAFMKIMKEEERLSDFQYFDPIKPNISSSYNPFYYAMKQGKYQDVAVKIIATLPKGGGAATFYEKLQEEFSRLLASLLSIIPYTEKMVNFIDLYAIIAYLPRSIEYLIEEYNIKGKKKDELAELWIKTVAQEAKSNKDYKNYLRNLQQHLALYAFTFHPKLLNAYEPEIKISEGFRKGKLMYFALRALDFPSGESLDIGKMVFLDLMGHAAWKYNSGIKFNVPDMVFVDEAPQVFVPEAEKLFDMARGAGIGVVLIHQSIFQFEKIQRGLFQNIFSNCAVKILLGAGDDETAKFYAGYLGEEIKYLRSRSVGGQNPLKSFSDAILPHWGEVVQEKYDYRVRPEELKTLPPGSAYLITKKHFGLKGKLYYFADDSPVSVEHLLPKRNYSDYLDEEKGLVLLKKFRSLFGQEEYADEIARKIAGVRKQIKEVLDLPEDKPAFVDSKDEFTDLTTLFAVDQVDKDFLPLPPD
ncbi:MAG: type IV secretory system conjugative DNA transfer family protein [Nitrososphaerales archaeon]